MSNLLPETEKKSVIKEYRMRRRIVALYLVIPLVLVGAILLVPPYIYASHSASVARSQAETLKAEMEASTGVDTDTIIEDANNKLGLIQKDIKEEDSITTPSKAINTFLSYMNSSITLKNIFCAGSGKDMKLSVRGVASDDTSLLAFSKELEKEPIFTSVDLPVSTFVKSTDIDFSLTIGVAASSTKQ